MALIKRCECFWVAFQVSGPQLYPTCMGWDGVRHKHKNRTQYDCTESLVDTFSETWGTIYVQFVCKIFDYIPRGQVSVIEKNGWVTDY